jgi:hypothetical protein
MNELGRGVSPSRAALELGGLAARQEARKHGLKLCRSGILNVRSMLVVDGVEQYFVQASPIEDFATFSAPREVLFFFWHAVARR